MCSIEKAKRRKILGGKRENDDSNNLSDEEKINRELNALFPNAPSRSIREYKGKWYQVRYFPVKRTKEGVTKWGRKWVPVAEKKSKGRQKKL